jgi:hypothetical protein
LNEFFHFFHGLLGKIKDDTDAAALRETVEEARSDENSSSLKDAYFLKACDEGFISEDTFDKLRTNTHWFANLITEYFPEPQKKKNAKKK